MKPRLSVKRTASRIRPKNLPDTVLSTPIKMEPTGSIFIGMANTQRSLK
jgi:hypothetical protein